MDLFLGARGVKRLLFLLHLLLDDLRVFGHVFLAAHLLNLLDDAVGQFAQHLVGHLVGRRLRHIDRCAVDHRALAFAGDDLPGLLDLARPDDCGGDDRAAGLQREARGTGVPLVQAPVGAAGAFHVDAEQLAAFDDLARMLEGAERFRAARTVHGEHADRREPPFLELSLEPLAFEVFGLAHEVDHAWTCQRQQRVVDDGQVVRRDDATALTWDVLETHCGRMHAMPCDRPQRLHEKPIQHASVPSPAVDCPLDYSSAYD